jgi:hypothetical protein
MKFIQLLREVLRLSLSKYPVLLFLVIIFISGCTKKSSDQSPVIQQLNDNPETLLKNVNALLHTEVSCIVKGNFTGDSIRQVTAVVDVNKKEEKISFNLIEIKNDKIVKRNETRPLEGSLKGCKIEKINLPGISNDLIFYNSQIYFMGSNSGEVFAYLIDFKTQKTYYAHLVSEPGRPESLYISETKNQEIRKYFIDNFRKDYPAFKITSRDRVLI